MNLELSPCLTDESGLRFLVTCGLFTPMVLHRFGIDNKDLSFGPVLLNQLVQIGVRIDISMGGSPKSPTFELVELVNYLMVSNAMALETQFPMVFSFHARKLFRDNFDYLYSISSSLSGQQSNEEINHGFLLQISRQVTEGQNMIQIMATLSNSAQGRLKYLLMKRKKSGDGDEICAGQVLNLAVAKEVLRL
ncbi:unnamed protein product [Kuraishia capsulata CBS 1993]|uniref:Uncharacterized protein n=1 Tax=Kuraishia capsulata CBS 1993 TaxID=1382522 RepID=W6MNV6_9ASCO|nr:uncharacterized protein KUCA_T00003938001 [Kuraishia capsulata CBS 1993]CDK27958.1 unnamed protein product [Kuraishia capsulata CBS 1993]